MAAAIAAIVPPAATALHRHRRPALRRARRSATSLSRTRARELSGILVVSPPPFMSASTFFSSTSSRSVIGFSCRARGGHGRERSATKPCASRRREAIGRPQLTAR
jgi:hypothetical protein